MRKSKHTGDCHAETLMPGPVCSTPPCSVLKRAEASERAVQGTPPACSCTMPCHHSVASAAWRRPKGIEEVDQPHELPVDIGTNLCEVGPAAVAGRVGHPGFAGQLIPVVLPDVPALAPHWITARQSCVCR